jgi:hypothetical protein
VEPHALALGTMKAFTLSFLCSRQEIINSSDRRNTFRYFMRAQIASCISESGESRVLASDRVSRRKLDGDFKADADHGGAFCA